MAPSRSLCYQIVPFMRTCATRGHDDVQSLSHFGRELRCAIVTVAKARQDHVGFG
jgi:hypothetical protein